MIRKIVLSCLVVVTSCLPAFAIEVPKEAQDMATKQSTLYTSKTFNDVLMASGLQELTAEAAANVPASYVKVSNDKLMFNNKNMAYPPPRYHDILTAYGLQISPEEVAARMGYISYAKTVNGKVVFGKTSTAYNKSEWGTILACYTTGAVVVTDGDADGDGVADSRDACPRTPKGIDVDERGCWTQAAEFLFAFDSAVLKKGAQSVLDDVKGIFDENPNLKVQIDGHTSDEGAEAYNQKLSDRRAQAVKDYLVNKSGVDASRLMTQGYGESRPAYPNDSEANRAKNRRVEFTPVN